MIGLLLLSLPGVECTRARILDDLPGTLVRFNPVFSHRIDEALLLEVDAFASKSREQHNKGLSLFADAGRSVYSDRILFP